VPHLRAQAQLLDSWRVMKDMEELLAKINLKLLSLHCPAQYLLHSAGMRPCKA
jgi:hypothetical protein